MAEAHAELDWAADRLYRDAPFQSDIDRFGHLLGMYGTMVHGRPDASDGFADFGRAPQEGNRAADIV